MHHVFFDTETYPIRGGLFAPAMVCCQWALDDGDVHVDLARMFNVEQWIEWLNSPFYYFVGHNLAYDLAVLCAHDKRLIQPIFRMLAQGRGRDTMIRETLKQIREGELDRKAEGKFTLETLARKYANMTLSKGQDSWLLRYALLDHMPVDRWPKEALDYAIEDVVATRAVHWALEDIYQDEWFQVACAFVLHLEAVWGVRVDGELLGVCEDKLLAHQRELADKLVKAGFKDTPDGSTKTKAIQAVVEAACKKAGIAVPMTEKGNVKTDEETIELIEHLHPALTDYADYKRNQKTLSTYINPMKRGIDGPMNSRPNVLVNSGRTSWGASGLEPYNPFHPFLGKPVEEKIGTNLQNFPRVVPALGDTGIRDCIVPRPGYWWLSVDYNSLELRTLAQCLIWITGHSQLAARYCNDPNYDPHTHLAAQILGITYEEGMKRKKEKQVKDLRQMAKAANFGFPGGMGPRKFITYAKNSYGVILTFQQARDLKEQWLRAFPEMHKYFEYFSYVSEAIGEFRQFVSNRTRGDVGFCDGCNTAFQGLAADGAKRSSFAVSMECYAVPDSPLFGCRPVVMIHDENCLEVFIERAHEAAMRTVWLMETEMQKVVPDVPIKASPALSTRWLKAAEEKFDKSGRLTAWDLKCA